MSGMVKIRPAEEADRGVIRALVESAFAGPAEADLVEALVADADEVLELVAEIDEQVVGHALFSRLAVESAHRSADAVALAPLAVDPAHRRKGVATALVEEAHRQLRLAGETLSVVLGDPAYYGRFGYTHARAAGFASDYQGEALQALSWDSAPSAGRLVYAAAFGAF